MFRDELECVECGVPLTEDEDESEIEPVCWDGEDPLCGSCWQDIVGYDEEGVDDPYSDY